MTTSHVSEGGSLAAEKRLLQIEIALFAKAGEWDKENWGHATKASMFLRQTANDIHYATNIIRALESPAESVRLAEMVAKVEGLPTEMTTSHNLSSAEGSFMTEMTHLDSQIHYVGRAAITNPTLLHSRIIQRCSLTCSDRTLTFSGNHPSRNTLRNHPTMQQHCLDGTDAGESRATGGIAAMRSASG